MSKALVTGAGGFIGSHLVCRLRDEGFWVRGVDLKRPEFSETAADEFIVSSVATQMPFTSMKNKTRSS
jgi:nucleoside-diphosphate-sugar epimerase